jgi:4-hydroxy-tetrahydrodipicolinate synthase
MSRTKIISAIGTPLAPDESLHCDGLRAHLDDQWRAGIDGLLVAGTMGLLQLLSDSTYRQLVEKSLEFSQGQGELLVGAGDCSFVRTRDRIELLNRFKLDGIVLLNPYFMHFSQPELVDYYRALADFSRHPLYLYHLPSVTHSDLTWDTVAELSGHANIRGIKCSCDLGWTQELRRRVDDRFRVIVAVPEKVDVLIQDGWDEHLDGVFSLAPGWISTLRRLADAGDAATAASWQRQMNLLLGVVRHYGVFPTFTVLLNARGIGGNYAPRPYALLHDDSRLAALLEEPVVKKLLGGGAVPAPKMMTSRDASTAKPMEGDSR